VRVCARVRVYVCARVCLDSVCVCMHLCVYCHKSMCKAPLTHTHQHKHTNTHSLSLSLSLSHTHTQMGFRTSESLGEGRARQQGDARCLPVTGPRTCLFDCTYIGRSPPSIMLLKPSYALSSKRGGPSSCGPVCRKLMCSSLNALSGCAGTLL